MQSRSYSGYLAKRWESLKKNGFNLQSFVTGYEITPDSILQEICDLRSDDEETSPSQSIQKDTDDMLKLLYIAEVWNTEIGGPRDNHTQLVCADVVDEKWDEVAKSMQDEHSKYDAEKAKRVGQQLANLNKVLKAKFFETGTREEKQQGPELNEELLSRLHMDLMEGLLDKPGQYRETLAGPTTVPEVIYLVPARIPGRLKTLLSFTNRQVESLREQYKASNTSDRTEKTKMFILLGALYFSEFLFIHPFPNGNGRTARISLNLLLTDVCEVPFSLFVCPPLCDESARSLYLKTLSMVHECMTAGQQSVLPTALATYILLCIQRHCGMMRYELVSEE
eukprot:scpid82293/ scgid31847/ 